MVNTNMKRVEILTSISNTWKSFYKIKIERMSCQLWLLGMTLKLIRGRFALHEDEVNERVVARQNINVHVTHCVRWFGGLTGIILYVQP